MDHSKELDRLSTYAASWPNYAKISPLSLARAGFSAVGSEDEVECFQCQSRLKGWTETEGHDPLTRHRKMAPHCPFLTENNCRDNVSLDSYVSLSNTCNMEVNGCQTESDCAGIINVALSNSDERLIRGSLIYMYNQALLRAQKRGLFLNNKVSTIDRNRPDFRRLQDERERLSTFYDWSSNASVNPVDLAREGFFYTGTADRVQCVHCGGCLRDWEPTDDPCTEHRKSSPNCPSFRGSEFRSDHLISERNTVDRGVVHRSLETSPLHANGSNPILGSTTERRTSLQFLGLLGGAAPKFPEYFEFSARLESFREGIVAVGQTAEGLADAGWFYVGPNDKVRCFQCGGNLRDWEPDDDPWAEHNRWYEHCQYIRTNRPTKRSMVPENPIPTVSRDVVGHGVEPNEVEAQLDTPSVQMILNMGYSLDRVKAVIESRLATTGDDFPNIESLLDAIFQLEETETAATGGAAVLTSESVKTPAHLSSSASSVSSGSSGYSTLSSSSSSSSSSLASASNDNSRISLKAETAALSLIPEANQAKTKAPRKKKIKKKNTTASSTAAIAEEEKTEEARYEEPSILEKTLLDENRLEEIMDEDAMRYLEEENRLMRDQRTCKVCMSDEVNTVFLPCGHLVCCATCSPKLRHCPICRTFIRGTVKTFLS